MSEENDEVSENGNDRFAVLRNPGSWFIIGGLILLIISVVSDLWGTYDLKRTAFTGENLVLVGVIIYGSVGYIKHKTPKLLCEHMRDIR